MYSICVSARAPRDAVALSDSDIRMSVGWKNSGGDQAVLGVKTYEKAGYLVFLAPTGSK